MKTGLEDFLAWMGRNSDTLAISSDLDLVRSVGAAMSLAGARTVAEIDLKPLAGQGAG